MKNFTSTRTFCNRAFAGIATLLFVTTAMLNAQSAPSYAQLLAAHPG